MGVERGGREGASLMSNLAREPGGGRAHVTIFGAYRLCIATTLIWTVTPQVFRASLIVAMLAITRLSLRTLFFLFKGGKSGVSYYSCRVL